MRRRGINIYDASAVAKALRKVASAKPPTKEEPPVVMPDKPYHQMSRSERQARRYLKGTVRRER